MSLEQHLRIRRDGGAKLLVPYVTANVRDDWTEIVRAVADAGADAIEIGFPFSDPVMDGPVIQESSLRALERGTTPQKILNELKGFSIDVPLVVMLYYNTVYRFGFSRFASRLAGVGFSGAIVPDVTFEESAEWRSVASTKGVASIGMVAPTTPDDRLHSIVDVAEGFVYAIGTMGVTGVRSELAHSAAVLGDRVKVVTDKPVLIGVGVSNADQASEAAAHADGVIVGSAVIRRILEGDSPDEIGKFVNELKTAIS